MNGKWLFKHKKIKKIFQKEGFYMVLFLGVCMVGVTALCVSRIKTPAELKLPSIEEEIINPSISEEEKEPTIVVEKMTADEIDKSKESTSQFLNKKEAKSQGKKIQGVILSENSLAMPVSGKVCMDYGRDKLVYSKTLGQYMTHKGIDIATKENEVIEAVLEGKVDSIKKDPKLGIMITISHKNGVFTKYGNLDKNTMVHEGDHVSKGQKIGRVGKSALFEISQGPHLHFEVMVNGKNKNPKLFLKKLN